MAHRLAALADDSSGSSGGHLDVSLQFDFFLGSEEVFLLQFAVDSALGLNKANIEC